MSQKKAASKQAVSSSKAPIELEQGTENLGKIRDIIFGANMREYEQRFDQIEQALEKQVQRLRDDSDNRMDKFESYVKDELKKLSEKLVAEKKDRQEEEKSIANDMSALEDRMTSAIGDVDAQLAHDAREIRESLRDQVKDLMNSMRELQDDMSKSLNQESGALKDSKVDREALADMLTEVSMRLKGELTLPEA